MGIIAYQIYLWAKQEGIEVVQSGCIPHQIVKLLNNMSREDNLLAPPSDLRVQKVSQGSSNFGWPFWPCIVTQNRCGGRLIRKVYTKASCDGWNFSLSPSLLFCQSHPRAMGARQEQGANSFSSLLSSDQNWTKLKEMHKCSQPNTWPLSLALPFPARILLARRQAASSTNAKCETTHDTQNHRVSVAIFPLFWLKLTAWLTSLPLKWMLFRVNLSQVSKSYR